MLENEEQNEIGTDGLSSLLTRQGIVDQVKRNGPEGITIKTRDDIILTPEGSKLADRLASLADSEIFQEAARLDVLSEYYKNNEKGNLLEYASQKVNARYNDLVQAYMEEVKNTAFMTEDDSRISTKSCCTLVGLILAEAFTADDRNFQAHFVNREHPAIAELRRRINADIGNMKEVKVDDNYMETGEEAEVTPYSAADMLLKLGIARLTKN